MLSKPNGIDKRTKTGNQQPSTQHRGGGPSTKAVSKFHGPNAAQPDLPWRELDKICQEYKHRLNVSDLEQSNIEQQTKDQADNQTGLWYEQRQSRLTASNFGTVAKRRSTTLCKAALVQ